MIYVIRHGETDLNKIAIMQGGGTNPPLNELGHKQAFERGQTLVNLGIEKIYCSDLIRTKQTADEMNKSLNLPITYNSLLRETYYGIMEGKMESVINSNPALRAICDAIDNGDNDAHFKDGESRNMSASRFVKFLKTLDDKTKNLLIVTHGGILRNYLKVYGNIDFKVSNCGGASFDLDKNLCPINITLIGKARE
ncbi:MAG: histidine phosphatase family protein [bacterium]|nr:histidine phosphatase family protein [bacterium]